MLEKLPIGRKLTLIIFFSNIVVLLLVFAITSLWNVNSIKSASIQSAENAAKVFSQDFTKIIVLDSPRVAADTVSRLRAIPNIKNAVLFNMAEIPVFEYYQSEADKIVPPPVNNPKAYFENGFLHIFARVSYEGKQYGVVYYRMSTDLLDETLNRYTISIAFFLVIVLASSLLISYRFQKLFSSPVVHLARILERVSKNKDLSVRVHTDEQNEIGQLYNGFNVMIENIAQQQKDLREKNRELVRHRTELETIVAERTKDINDYAEELEAFSYSVSHDLRAPLRSVHGFSMVLAEDYGELLDTQGRDILSRIQAASVRMNELIDDLLQLSGVNRHEIEIETVNLSAMAEDILETESMGIDKIKNMEIIIKPDIKIIADVSLMRIALNNLLSNAIKYSAKKDHPCISIGSETSSDGSIVYIKDNGVGFDMKYVDKIFLPFERLHSADQYSGTGIGLATVKRIIKRHGGRIWAESHNGEGATFYFKIGKVAHSRSKKTG